MFGLISSFSLRDRGLLCSGACGLFALSLSISTNIQTVSLQDHLRPYGDLAAPLRQSIEPDIQQEAEDRGKQSAKMATDVVVAPRATADEVHAGRVAATRPFQSLFGTQSVSVSGTAVIRRWKSVIAEDAANAILVKCTAKDDAFCDLPRVVAMQKEVQRLRGSALELQVRAVNEFVNRTFRYSSDVSVYGVPDHWASLREFLTNGRGDCEDFAIAKMWMLSALGVSESVVRMVVLRDEATGQDHAVLVVDGSSDVWVLDNRFGVVRRDAEMRHYRPYYSLSMGGQSWAHSTSEKPAVSSVAHYPRPLTN